MAINRIGCPECGAWLKSTAGFTLGQSISCPKCETDFTVEDPGLEVEEAPVRGGKKGSRAAAIDDGEQWSYRNSWIRFAVLGVLLVTLGVLGYLYYEKQQGQNKDIVNNDDGEEGKLFEPKKIIVPPGVVPLQPQIPAGAGAPGPVPGAGGGKDGGKAGGGDNSKAGGKKGGGGKGKGKEPPPKLSPTELTAAQTEELKKGLIGKWESGADSVEYKDDGSFAFVGKPEGKDEQQVVGTWLLIKAEKSPAPGSELLLVDMEWTVDGKPKVRERVIVEGKVVKHPMLDRLVPGKVETQNFTKK